MKENLGSEKISKKEKVLPTADRCAIQRQLIEEFCEIKNMDDAKQKNVCALDWVEKYADNFDQLNKELINRYKNAHNEQEKEVILDTIQKALEILDKING